MGWSGSVNVHDAGLLSSILRRWEERYDAILVGLGFAVMYLAVRRPPLNARQAAAEQYMFAPDVVDQGTGSFEALAWEIHGAPVWTLYWD
jgi:hypothetical protein